MISAGKEEREIVITNNSYHQGVPAVTVIVDGGWSKHSHKHSYNAKSGVAIIIGKATGKILHMEEHNKFCSICDHHPETPPSDICDPDLPKPDIMVHFWKSRFLHQCVLYI